MSPILRLDWEEDHTALLSYMGELTDWHWEALGPRNGLPRLAFGPWETEWTGYQGKGVRPDWQPQKRYNVARRQSRCRVRASGIGSRLEQDLLERTARWRAGPHTVGWAERATSGVAVKHVVLGR